ncbi:MAG: hypothetical protein D6701_05790 [Gemmatimonadetes bacterium]|nr:MAG: hypothetical protein D6701_05790 [Gemmatimonadota bacterium]
MGVDKARGEFRRPVLVVPAFSVAVEPGTMAWPVHDGRPREVTVVVRTEDPIPVEASLALEAPEGWTVSPERVALPYEHEGASRSVTFTVTPPAAPAPGRVRLRAVALTGSGRRYDHRIDVIDYPHIPRAVVDAPAEAAVTVLPVRVRPGLRVGYIQGSGDAGAEALRQIGVDVVELGPDAVRAGAYDGFDALVLGIRVYETRPDVVAANAQILAFAERGGTVVVQYNKYEYPRGGFAPYPVSMSRPAPRVTDESAVVRPLDPEAPLLTSPNRITAADFEGWVQERGLYFLSEWDERFTPLLEMADPGEEPVRGALVYAPVGRGLYVYTGLSFFRQFPAGVPGAYRLFANLVSARVEDLR